MGCTSGKTSNPNKNLNNNPVQQRPPQNESQNLPKNQSSMIPSMPVQSNMNSNIVNPTHMNSSILNQPNMNYNTLNQPAMQQGMTTPTKIAGQQGAYQGNANLGYQGSNQMNGMTPSMQNPLTASPNNLHTSQLNQNGHHLGSPHLNNSLHTSGFKPGQYETHDTTDDEMVNQEKSMNFDLGIKFNMQIEVQ